MTNNYARACTEVLEIISYFNEEEYSKIPESEIKFLEKNKDTNYDYEINPQIDLSEQEISNEANAILISLFKNYFATEKQKITLNNLLSKNQAKEETEKKEKYNPNDIFKSKEKEYIESEKIENNEKMIEYKETFFQKFVNFIKRLISK